MSLSIEELDATVRAFYEGRGDTVCDLAHRKGFHRARLLANRFPLAKTSPSYVEPGRRPSMHLSRHTHLTLL